jgi:hypothetical protein
MNGDAVLDAGLHDADGRATTLREHLVGGGLVAVFVRHYG